MTTSVVSSATNPIAQKLDAIQQKAAMRSVDVANVAKVRQETVSRWRSGKSFPQPETQKILLELEYVADRLSEFYSPQEARLWLLSRQKILQGAVPAELIQAGKTDDVIRVIDQLRDEVYL